MNKEIVLKVIFAVIFLGNLILAAWNYIKSDFIEFGISLLIVVLIAVGFLIASRKKHVS